MSYRGGDADWIRATAPSVADRVVVMGLSAPEGIKKLRERFPELDLRACARLLTEALDRQVENFHS